MNITIKAMLWLMTALATLLILAPATTAQGIYSLTYEEVTKHKSFYDDPRPLFTNFPLVDVVPPDIL